ncbi:unnamed protein product [Bemisia tabaci]|uniref:Folate receptor-like domain-containing protein n=1 Tax=Bemisia tabaci TaxID=7038 RepID=A0A9P0AJ25_BEMTA|nr:unnamed protein product [Bemisia tabaci]
MILCNSWSSFMGKRSPRCFPQAGHGLAAMILTLLVCIPTFLADTAYAPEELNYCIDGLNHKKEPGPESDLYKECSPWKHRSCCTFDTTYNAHHSNNHGFNFDHCSHVKIMSERCRRHFIQDLCFYECSPNVGPWVVKVPHKQSKERFFEVPLCQIDCDSWFDACRHDYTCAEIWGRNGFQWKNHTNYCKESSTCRTFEEVYNNNAKNFCEKLRLYVFEQYLREGGDTGKLEKSVNSGENCLIEDTAPRTAYNWKPRLRKTHLNESPHLHIQSNSACVGKPVSHYHNTPSKVLVKCCYWSKLSNKPITTPDLNILMASFDSVTQALGSKYISMVATFCGDSKDTTTATLLMYFLGIRSIAHGEFDLM